jgi:hypothetical protein
MSIGTGGEGRTEPPSGEASGGEGRPSSEQRSGNRRRRRGGRGRGSRPTQEGS